MIIVLKLQPTCANCHWHSCELCGSFNQVSACSAQWGRQSGPETLNPLYIHRDKILGLCGSPLLATVILQFLVLLAQCTLQSLAWLKYWNGKVTRWCVAHGTILFNASTILSSCERWQCVMWAMTVWCSVYSGLVVVKWLYFYCCMLYCMCYIGMHTCIVLCRRPKD